MRTSLASATLLLIALTTGCATVPPLQTAPPSPTSVTYGFGTSPILAKGDHMTQPLNAAKSVYYFQNQGGGGAGLGLLLGPIGVASNVKMIESTTMGDVKKLYGKFAVDAEAQFREVATKAGFAVAASARPGDVRLMPYLLVSKTDPGTVHISPVIRLEGGEGKKTWAKFYRYQLAGKYTVDELVALDDARKAAIREQSAAAFTSLLAHMQGETDAEIAKEQRIVAKSQYMTPRFNFDVVGSLAGQRDGLVWVRTSLGVTAVQPGSIEYQVVENKKK